MKDPFRGRGPRLKPLNVPGHPAPVDLEEGSTTLGRSADNAVCLAAEEFPSVSTHHARIDRAGSSLTVVDLESRNGTLVNGKRVASAALEPGDVIQLGPVGPRFLVVSATPLSETMFVDASHIEANRKPDLSETAVRRIVVHRSRRGWFFGAALGTVVVVALVTWSLQLSRSGREERAVLERDLRDTESQYAERLARAQRVIEELQERERVHEASWKEAEEKRERGALELRLFMEGLGRESTTLQERIRSLEEDDDATAEIAALRAELEDTRGKLIDAQRRFDLLDPVSVESSRLLGVGRVREAVVLLETTLTLEDTETGEVLRDSVGGSNFGGLGQPWTMESTGSGFTISPEGWILTNAHVVSAPKDNEILAMAQGLPLATRVSVEAVFSDTERRHPVEVVKVDDDDDLALVRIEPFEGMPWIEGFDTEVGLPGPGSDVYLFGFPLGNFALQEGERVIASTFRGILSRVVGGNIQVDAGVHPGNSGGPITDSQGRVIGVVFSVQALPGGEAVYTIGYGIPIERAQSLWPPRVEAAVAAEAGVAEDG